MRTAFIESLIELAEQDPRVMLLTGDLGFMVFEQFIERFPQQFLNVGVAEQNMVGIATGLAEAGFIPFCYSIVTFASLRPYEFIRNGPVQHRLPVRIIGMGGGFEYGHAGPTHHGLEDVGVMRVQPGLTVIAPADGDQTRAAIRATWDMPIPIYYRLGKNDRVTVPGLGGRFDLGRVHVIRRGGDVLMLSMGSIAAEMAQAAEILADDGISTTAAVVSTLNPPPIDDLISLLSQFPLVFTAEAHYLVGGLGSLVSEIAAENGLGCRVIRCGVRSVVDGLGGSENYLNHLHGLSSKALVETVHRAVGNSFQAKPALAYPAANHGKDQV